MDKFENEILNVELEDTWTLYLHYKDLGKYYNENLEKLIDISDIITFWKTFNNIPKIYDIFSDGINIKKMKRNNATPCAYSFFRYGIEPCWEDSKNSKGFEFSVKNSKNLIVFHNEWINCILEIISNNNEMYKHINGIRIVDCTKCSSVLYRMEFWIDTEDVKNDIEKILKEDNFCIKNYKFMYRTHQNIKEIL
jgi:hypothetical protein